MDDFYKSLHDLVPSAAVFAFGAVCAMMAVIVVLLDWVGYSTHGRSFLRLAYGGSRTVRLFLLWGVGAGLGGFLGAAFEIVQVNTRACILVGVAWPVILPRLIQSAAIEEPVEEATAEDEQ